MVAVLYTLATLSVIYYLARRLYDRKIALTTLLILTFTPAYIELIPVYFGRQILGEMPRNVFLVVWLRGIIAFAASTQLLDLCPDTILVRRS